MSQERLIHLATESLRVSSNRLRINLDEKSTSISELAQSIASLGVIEPLIVRSVGEQIFEVIAGERRLIAARMLKLEMVPCIVNNCSDSTALLTALTENLQRSDLSPVERAQGLRRLLEDYSLTQFEVSRLIGISQSAIAHHLRLLALPQEVMDHIHRGALSLGHGKLLAGVDDPKMVMSLASDCLEGNKSVRELEQVMSQLPSSSRQRNLNASGLAKNKKRNEVELENGVFLMIKEDETDVSGTIQIPFYSRQEKEWILGALGKAAAARRSPQVKTPPPGEKPLLSPEQSRPERKTGSM